MKTRERRIRRVICEIENSYPKDNIITNYKDFLKHRHCLPFYKFNKEVFISLVNVAYDLWDTKERINRASLIQIIKFYYAKSNGKFEIDLETSEKLFYFYKQIVYFEKVKINKKALDELKVAINRICTNMILSENNQKWLCHHFYDSDYFLNRLIRYKEKSPIISNWARYIYKTNILSDRRAELASWIIDEDPTFEINYETIINDYLHIFSHSINPTTDTYKLEIERIELIKRQMYVPPEVKLIPRDLNGVNKELILKGYLRVPYALVNEYIANESPIIRINNYISKNEELLIRASNLWATGYSRLSKKDKSKRLKKYYAEDVEKSFLKICNRYKLKEPLNWLVKIND